ncbi:sugar 3,4-ketoisomerase [Belliella kenyensis]|uniref:Sugar 3,4-ketoisomerase n=1 Tax=Belliella kenyensis TaxID=1472724 RepID=A0ABV8EN13_9BACT|nr:FdtA/QdtA family cupin domain-containing protein [Belliella kenyensis]MCH7400636.1 FdtA/QdtA family cupin domain-containing protein [Belliella kenyensis]MDN3602077.1 FdtA/QdtA family cupin domain-containing protein [Belliella kenyensis]
MNNFIFPKLISFDGHARPDGQIRFMSSTDEFDFDVKRVFWISDVPEGSLRGVHAHKKEVQLLIAMSGVLIVELEGKMGDRSRFVLDSPSKGLIIPAMYWSSVEFGEQAILLGMGNMGFDEEDYIRDRDEFDQA